MKESQSKKYKVLQFEEIESLGNTGRYILDGFPRSQDNWESWTKIIGNSVDTTFLLMFECSEAVMEQRLLKRGETSGRADDNAETIKKRFATFINETKPIVADFEKKNKVVKVSAEASPDEVYENVKKALSNKGVQPQKDLKCYLFQEDQVQAKELNFSYGHLSTGDLLREEQKKEGPIQAELKSIMEAGKLVPSDLVVKLMKKVKRKFRGKYLLDGFPHNQENIDSWNKILATLVDVNCLLYFECSDAEMTKRLLERAKTSGRADDNEETIKKRLATFHSETKPVLGIFKEQNKLKVINSEQLVDVFYSNVKKIFKTSGLTVTLNGQRPAKGKYIIGLVGAPGTGKQVQSSRISKRFGFQHLSIKIIIRDEIKKNTQEAQTIKDCQKNNQPIPGKVVVKLILAAISQSKARNFIVDGSTRNEDNLNAWYAQTKSSCKIKIYYVFCMFLRTADVGNNNNYNIAKKDQATIQRKVETLNFQTNQIIQMFKKDERLIENNTEPSIDKVFAEIERVFITKKLDR
ncbi:unnamed protein product (macronuclear) [Paramecium tetraurelia]|uniref:Adenylate kinase n=1 Tax=Paramecium tetraurelia TaxID=5888 RepID=A0DZR4_PARTE|nr:uncharacterized protein GSPATT00021699001 [Paramecium tetraurelia]CAK88531.1 unnamed protein product [Paramecium tetraurelia]|eukprot:XP_001455928.1 hypothetical protein (macronuclear) [Paramecium tetraurelia strain d4-2]